MKKETLKTPFRLWLEGFESLLHADKLTTAGGQMCSLYSILYELEGLDYKFRQMLAYIHRNEYHCEALDFDRDVNYSEWAGDSRLCFHYTLSTLPQNAAISLDIQGVDHTMTDGLNALSEEELVCLIQQKLIAFKALLAEIGEALKNFRPDAEALFLEEEAKFMKEHGEDVCQCLYVWKERLDHDPELIRKHMQGKITTEFVRLVRSGALDAKFLTQFEADTEQYLPEVEQFLTSLIPHEMNTLCYYSALRELMDYTHGELLPRMRQLGAYIFRCRKEISLEAREGLFFFLAILKLIYQEKEPEKSAAETCTSAFSRIVQHEEPALLMERLHQLIDGRKGADVGCVLLKCCQEGYLIRRPTQREFESEFTLTGRWTSIHKYMDDNNENALDRANQIIIFS